MRTYEIFEKLVKDQMLVQDATKYGAEEEQLITEMLNGTAMFINIEFRADSPTGALESCYTLYLPSNSNWNSLDFDTLPTLNPDFPYWFQVRTWGTVADRGIVCVSLASSYSVGYTYEGSTKLAADAYNLQNGHTYIVVIPSE